MAEEKFLTQEQADLINCETLARFFATPIGQKLRNGTPYLREFKFSILEDAGAFGPELEGEQILLQGVVDCALLEPEGITVLDFKTDGGNGGNPCPCGGEVPPPGADLRKSPASDL